METISGLPTIRELRTTTANTPFTIPPSSTPSLGDLLDSSNISWKYYGDQWNSYIPDPYQENYGSNGPNADGYCSICNPFQYDTSIMSNPTQVINQLISAFPKAKQFLAKCFFQTTWPSPIPHQISP